MGCEGRGGKVNGREGGMVNGEGREGKGGRNGKEEGRVNDREGEREHECK